MVCVIPINKIETIYNGHKIKLISITAVMDMVIYCHLIQLL